MKRWLPAIILICLVAGVAWYFTRRPEKSGNVPATTPQQEASTEAVVPRPATPTAPSAADSSGASPSTPADTTSSASALAKPPGRASAASDSSGLPPAAVLENMRTAIRLYGSMFDGNPVGTNLEITRALDGDNPKQARFLKPEAGMRTNPQGELIDPWGTPYFFHQLSGHEMEIRSAGPDKIMWTSDDLVAK
jgi:hypothetical protein